MSRLPDLERALRDTAARLDAEASAARGRRRRRRAWRVALVAVPAAIVLAVVLAIGRGGDGGARLTLADKAYAATSGPGVRHWKLSIRTYIDGRQRGVVQRQEGWARGETMHLLLFEGKRVTIDVVTTPGRSRSWDAGSNDYIDVKQSQRTRHLGPMQFGDPLAEFRWAHDHDKLIRVDATTYRMKPDRMIAPPGSTLTYELDPKTALPVRAAMEYTRGRDPAQPQLAGARYRIVFSYDAYEQLDDSAANRAKLEMLPHPGAGPSTTDARSVFAILREGEQLNGRQRRMVRGMAKGNAEGGSKAQLDPSAARRGPHGVILMPGKGYVAVLRKDGGTILTVDVAVQRGARLGGAAVNRAEPMYVIVADDVTAVRGRLGRGGWKTYPVEQNVAVLPRGGYQVRLVRSGGAG